MTWGPEAKNPAPKWTMSVSLENVPRGDGQLPELTDLREAIETWRRLDTAVQDAAILRRERPLVIDGAQLDRFEGQGIAAVAKRLTA